MKKDGEAFYLEVDITTKDKPRIRHEQAVALAAEVRLWLGNDNLMKM